MQTIIIAGAAGFIGSHLCNHFLNNDYTVVAIDNLLTGNLENLSNFFPNPNFQFVQADITREIYNKLPKIRDLKGILHFASPASPKDYIKYPFETMKANSVGTEHLLYLAWSYNARFIYASTSEIYGDPLINPQVEEYYGNVNSVGIRSCYDEAKRYGETMTMLYHNYHKVNTGIVRIFNTYGRNMRTDDGRLIPTLINQALNNEPLTIYGKGMQTRSFCYIDDLINGIDKLFNSDYYSPINIGNNEEITILKCAMIIKGLTNSNSNIEFHPLGQDDPLLRCPDLTKAHEVLGYYPTVSLREGLAKTIEFFRGNFPGII